MGGGVVFEIADYNLKCRIFVDNSFFYQLFLIIYRNSKIHRVENSNIAEWRGGGCQLEFGYDGRF